MRITQLLPFMHLSSFPSDWFILYVLFLELASVFACFLWRIKSDINRNKNINTVYKWTNKSIYLKFSIKLKNQNFLSCFMIYSTLIFIYLLSSNKLHILDDKWNVTFSKICIFGLSFYLYMHMCLFNDHFYFFIIFF